MPWRTQGECRLAVDVRVLSASDAAILERVAPDVFAHRIDPELTTEFLSNPSHHMVVALDGDTVVGMASAIDYVHPDKPIEMWIKEVGVTPACRKSGVGYRLVQALLTLARERGCREAWVATEHHNLAAKRLYTGTGGESASFVMYAFNLRESDV